MTRLRRHAVCAVGFMLAWQFVTAAGGGQPTGGATIPDDDGWTRAQPGYAWRFPRDHGSHPPYQIEWWYYTG
ncbi:MAG: hypothetical protein J4F30_09850, partial [Acidobacteria bacterium]|nr:hypothetical protein [Acidobacteriota bacterium]